jgi:peptide-methionine (S)-S-oxide reductase
MRSLLLLFCLLLGMVQLPMAALAAAPQEAVLAGGCFWCLEHDLKELPGVLEAVSGFAGGTSPNPTYKQVSAGGTGYVESVRVRFDPDRISYPALLRAYWRNVDPSDSGGQFCDRGSSYRPVIFTASPQQLAEAKASSAAAQAELGTATPVKLAIEPLRRFWPAEKYHQDFAVRNKAKYGFYRWSCGRDARLDAIWGKRARSGQVWVSPPATTGQSR